jgi:hypothetical protein
MLLTKRIETLLEQLPKNVLDEDWSSMLKVMKENPFERFVEIFKMDRLDYMYNRSIPMKLITMFKKNLEQFSPYKFPCDLTVDMLVEYKDIGWNWKFVTSHPNITFDDIMQHPELPWDDVLYNKTVPVDYVLQNLDTIDKEDDDLPFLWDTLLENGKITLEKYLKDGPKKSVKRGGYIKTISIKDIEDNNHIDWDWQFISMNPNLTIETILKYPSKKWYWTEVSANKGITMEDINNHLDLSWSWSSVSRNPNLTIDMVISHLDKGWDWHWITKNRAITLEMITKHPELPFLYNSINENPNLTPEFILAHPEYPWDNGRICENPMDGEQKRMKKKLKVLEKKLIKIRDTKELLYSWKKDTIFSFLVNDILDMISCYA